MAALSRGFAPVLLLAVLTGLALSSVAGAQVTRHGILRAEVSENLERGESKTTYSLQSGGETTPILPTSPPSADAGDAVIATGTMHDGAIVGSVAPAADSALVQGSNFVGPRRVMVLLVKFPGDAAEPWSPEETREKVFTGTASASAYFREESHGLISVEGKANPEEGDVFGWFTLNRSGSGCAARAWGEEAFELAFHSGIPVGGYHHFVYVFTHRPGCFWNGMATLGGNGGTVYINGNVGVRTIAHELGHNFGLFHAGSLSCTQGGVRVQISSSCSVNPYGDAFDVMGNIGTRHNNGWNLAKLALLGPAHVVTATDDGTYPLRAALSLSPAPMILRIPRTKDAAGNVISWYYLEVRQRGGIFEDFADASMTGVTIRTAEYAKSVESGLEHETALIDANPATPTFTDAPLQVGETFLDGIVRIRTLSAGGGAASVSVDFLALNDSEPPTAPAGVSANQDAAGVRLHWDPSTDDAIVSKYLVFRDGSQVGTTPTLTYTDKDATLGLHAYTVYAEDLAGNRSAASEPSVVTVGDILAPSVPTGLAASQDASAVKLQWADSTDNVGVAGYAVIRDGAQIGTSPTPAFTDLGVPPGNHTYVVHAEDGAGNRSSGSREATVWVIGSGGPGNPPAPPESEEKQKGEKKRSRARPVLAWKRRLNGALVFKLDARRVPDAVRVTLWLDRRLLRSKAGRVLRFVWKPRALRCDHVYRFIGRAHASNGKRTVSRLRFRSAELGSGSDGCRGRKSSHRRQPR